MSKKKLSELYKELGDPGDVAEACRHTQVGCCPAYNRTHPDAAQAAPAAVHCCHVWRYPITEHGFNNTLKSVFRIASRFTCVLSSSAEAHPLWFSGQGGNIGQSILMQFPDASCYMAGPQTMLMRPAPLTVRGVFAALHSMAAQKGQGATKRRTSTVLSLLRSCRCGVHVISSQSD